MLSSLSQVEDDKDVASVIVILFQTVFLNVSSLTNKLYNIKASILTMIEIRLTTKLLHLSSCRDTIK